MLESNYSAFKAIFIYVGVMLDFFPQEKIQQRTAVVWKEGAVRVRAPHAPTGSRSIFLVAAICRNKYKGNAHLG